MPIPRPLNTGHAGLAGWMLLVCSATFAQGLPASSPRPAPPGTIAAGAASTPVPPEVSDAAAVVPAVVYRSVFATPPAGVEIEALDWKKANAGVGQFRRGHVDILKWEADQGVKP